MYYLFRKIESAGFVLDAQFCTEGICKSFFLDSSRYAEFELLDDTECVREIYDVETTDTLFLVKCVGTFTFSVRGDKCTIFKEAKTFTVFLGSVPSLLIWDVAPTKARFDFGGATFGVPPKSALFPTFAK